MRRLLGFLARPIVWSTLGVLILLLALHVVCPLLGVEDDNRWIIELLVGTPLAVFLVVYWVRQFLVERRLSGEMTSQAKQLANQQGPDAVRDFKAFSEDFTQAFAQLSRQCRERGVVGGVAALPWIMILGPSGVGKSTALDRSGLRFTSLGRRLQGIGGTRNCSWWLANDAVFLDTAGRYAVRDEDRDEWRAFLHLLAKRRRRPVDAVLLQVGIDELLDRPRADVERVAFALRERLDELTHFLDAQIPIHLLFNKCDCLEGFLEFFSALAPEEQAAAWGIQLDTQNLGADSLEGAFSKRFGELVRSLTERATQRMLSAPNPDTREAILSFPAEFKAIGELLTFFVQSLLEPRSRQERPWLRAVYFASAEQTGQRIAGLAQRRADELALPSISSHRLSPAVGTGANGDTFFLRGVFAQVLRQAETSARPNAAAQRKMRLRQHLAVGISVVLCAACSWYVGQRLSTAGHFLRQLEERCRGLNDAPGLPDKISKVSKDDLVAEINRMESVRVWLAEAPSGIPTAPGHEASLLLRRRIDRQWLLPLESQMQQDLERVAARKSGDPGEDFSRGFSMLRMLYVLRGNTCAGADPEQTRQAMAQFILDHWQRLLGDKGRWLALVSNDDEDPERPHTSSARMRRQLEYFFMQEPTVLRDSTHLRIDEALREQARSALGSGDDQSQIVFNLRVSLAGLYERKGQLSTPLLSESGIEQVFTSRGCATFFGPEAGRGSEWWKCVLDRPLPKDPPNLEDTYRQRYSEAWNRWLHDLSLRTPNEPKSTSPRHAGNESIADALRVLDGLIRDARPALPQVMQVVGRGGDVVREAMSAQRRKSTWYSGCGKRFGKSLDWGKQAFKEFKTPRECQAAQDLVLPFAQLTAAKKTTDEDADSGSAKEDYQKYLLSAKALRNQLARIQNSTERNGESLKLLQATMGTNGDLWALDVARTDVMASLQGRLSGSGLDVSESGLNRVLQEAEGLAFRALLPLAPQALNEQWKNQIWLRWKNMKENQQRQMTPDEDRCKQRTEFLRKEVAEFVSKSYAPFYTGNNLLQCSLKRMSFPFDRQMPLSTSACTSIRDAVKVGEEITDCPKAMGAGGGAPKRDLVRADVIPPAEKDCVVQAGEVRVDRGDKVFSCLITTGSCAESTTLKTSQRARLMVQWQNKPGFITLFEHEYPEELFDHAQKKGNQLIFSLPPEKAPNRCKGFQIIFQLAPGAGGPAPKKADNRWKTVDLPASLL